jgi:hypothetical protein
MLGRENVCRLSVAVDSGFRVSSVERVGNLDGQVNQLNWTRQFGVSRLRYRDTMNE